jgi:hypothetical protein
MPLGRTRFTIRSLIIAVALVGLNLAGGIATSRYYPRQPNVMEGWGYSPFRSFYGDGTVEIGRRDNGSPGRTIERVVLRPFLPTTLQIWTPLIGSVCTTVLVLVVRGWRRRADSIGSAPSPARLPRLQLGARWLLIVMALFGLNLAAASVFRPLPRRDDQPLDHYLRHSGKLLAKGDGIIEFRPSGGTGMIKPDGTYELQPLPPVPLVKSNRDADHGRSSDAQVPSPSYYDDTGRILGTVRYKPDGSIIGYEGTPGQIQGRSHVIRPPIRPFLQMWWPVIGSASITLLILGLLWREVRGQRACSAAEARERAGRHRKQAS